MTAAAAPIVPAAIAPSDEEIAAVLERARTAMNDWCCTYAADECAASDVFEAHKRIAGEHGTLAYIADVNGEIAALLSRLPRARAPAAQACPAGWQMVPIEPTLEMVRAADDYTNCGGHCGNRQGRGAYLAALAAAPVHQAAAEPTPEPAAPVPPKEWTDADLDDAVLEFAQVVARDNPMAGRWLVEAAKAYIAGKPMKVPAAPAPEDMVERVARAIALAMQFKDFGHRNADDEWEMTTAQIDEFSLACKSAARAAIAAATPLPVETEEKS